MTDKTRADFERFITSPPFEKSITRFLARTPELTDSCIWPVTYVNPAVELAWQSWMAATEEAER